MTEFDRDYFEAGPQTGKSLYQNYQWLPELTFPLAHHIANYLNLTPDDRILDFGCAKGYLVHALRKFGYDAYGIDISEYAIQNCHPEVKDFLAQGSLNSIFSDDFDFVVTKDVLEHIPYRDINRTLTMIADHTLIGCLAIVPLGDGEKYFVDAYEKDVTHHIREDLGWWEEELIKAGFPYVSSTYDLGPFKSNWNVHPKANGFLYAYK